MDVFTDEGQFLFSQIIFIGIRADDRWGLRRVPCYSVTRKSGIAWGREKMM